MAEELKSEEKADLEADEKEVQPGSGQPSGAVNGKESGRVSKEKPERFPRDHSFQFHFTAAEMGPAATSSTSGAAPGAAGAEQKQTNVGAAELPESPGGLESSASQKPERTQTTDSATEEDRGHLTSKNPIAQSTPGEEAVAEKAAADRAAQKKKKKKKQKASSSKEEKKESEISRKTKAEASECLNKDASHQDETAQQSEDQLRKEVDWCVEQLELGLKTQKPTPKQAEEALRAIRTLRSDKAPLVKKRQVMRSVFGDYRKRMEEDLCKQLKLMEAAMKSARVVEVNEDIRRKSCRVVRRRPGACRKSQDSAESPSASPGTSNTGSFRFRTSQENFYFNFF